MLHQLLTRTGAYFFSMILTKLWGILVLKLRTTTTYTSQTNGQDRKYKNATVTRPTDLRRCTSERQKYFLSEAILGVWHQSSYIFRSVPILLGFVKTSARGDKNLVFTGDSMDIVLQRIQPCTLWLPSSMIGLFWETGWTTNWPQRRSRKCYYDKRLCETTIFWLNVVVFVDRLLLMK